MSDPAELIDPLVSELPKWLPTQRWFGGKDRPITSVRPLGTTVLQEGDPLLLHMIVEVYQGDRMAPYQLVVASRDQLPEYLGSSWIGTERGRPCYEATGDADVTGRLLDLIAEGADVGSLKFRHEPGAEVKGGLRGRPITSEQSNTSLVYGNSYILKLFRKLSPGENPDLLLHRALQEQGCEHIAPLLGSITGDLYGEPATVGMLQQFITDAVDGWAMATTSVRDLMADPELPPDQVGGDFAGESQRLGQAVAKVHNDLRRALGEQVAEAEHLDEVVKIMQARLDSVAQVVPELAEYAPALRAAFEKLRELSGPVPMQYIHGDLHLGQVLRTVTGWLLLDFEGEPAAPLAERSALRSPLRDVAGMLRSFDYAAHQMLIGQPEDPKLTERALEWSRRNRDAFCDGYAKAAPESIGDPRSQVHLLRALELDKAVYEVAYEHANRPEWLGVPLASIARIAEEASNP
ncbi:maltokinase [Amycolatopsis bartoniae]|uniref:Maltokinase n=1 Tax=Amycolatopsis bartoniae TaxID=941986 RepID=A0A8H9J636_9PSEU|nr:phosphotransferase [Amycolatopsis bartoniae]MBB2936261.1 maltokinase [Amycolatopsis bartoniae]TVT11578.1 phosphotransferase [Amycolatopsis bartoniae]GHF80400.1 aminoglycoside phosphotransferase [Amycolatopsis bartoniae]